MRAGIVISLNRPESLSTRFEIHVHCLSEHEVKIPFNIFVGQFQLYCALD